MKLNISQELLAGSLSIVNKAVATRSVNPLLNQVKIVATADSMTLTGTDGEFTIRRHVAISGADEGRVLAPAKLMLDLVSRLPKKEITLESQENQLHISVDRSEYDLPILLDDTYPELPDYHEHRLITLPCAMLKHALTQTCFSAVRESSTGAVHYTNSAFFSFKEGRLDIVATDGHRLALKRSDGLNVGDVERDLLLPVRVAEELEKMLPDDEDAAVEVFHYSNQVFFSFGNQLVASALLDVKFPPYERVIPSDINSKVHAGREEMINALSRVLLVCRQKEQNPVANLETKESTVTLTSDGGEYGKGMEELAAEVNGEDIRIAINPQYIIDVLKVLGGEQVTINWTSEISPVMITSPRDPDFTYIVMPIRMD